MNGPNLEMSGGDFKPASAPCPGDPTNYADSLCPLCRQREGDHHDRILGNSPRLRRLVGNAPTDVPASMREVAGFTDPEDTE